MYGNGAIGQDIVKIAFLFQEGRHVRPPALDRIALIVRNVRGGKTAESVVVAPERRANLPKLRTATRAVRKCRTHRLTRQLQCNERHKENRNHCVFNASTSFQIHHWRPVGSTSTYP